MNYLIRSNPSHIFIWKGYIHMSKVRFTAFADLHHAPEWFKSEADERLAAIQKRAIASKSDLIVSLGDFSHFPTLSKELIDQYANTGIPAYHVLGNHEFDHDSLEDVVKAYGMPNAYYSFDFNGFRFIMLDNNTFSDYPGVYFHYSRRNYFDHGKGREYIAPEQVEWFRQTVESSPIPCIVMSHASLDYPTQIPNREEMLEIIRKSQNTPGRVMLCVNGHNHRNHLSVVDNVAYFDLNSATFDWVGKPHKFFPEEWYKKYECVGNQVIFSDPLSAVITLDTDGNLEIEGVESSFVCGVTREMTGNAEALYPCECNVLSAKVKL